MYKYKDTTQKIPLLSSSIWHEHFNMTSVVIVDISYDREIFDFCNLNVYTREGMREILSLFNVKNGRWVALYNQYKVIKVISTLSLIVSLQCTY